jgi:hypothetical protein
MSIAIAVNCLLLAGVVAWLVTKAWAPTEAARLRNALLLDVGGVDDFNWTPDTMPADFKAECTAPDQFFISVVQNAAIGVNQDHWVRACRITSLLVEHVRDSGPIRSDPITTFMAIRAGQGYCADFVKVFVVLAHAAGIGVRQWAFSFDGFGGHGHTFAEVWDQRRGKWLFLDVHNNICGVDAATGEPLSALEFRDFLLGLRRQVRIEAVGPGREGFPIRDKLLDYWRRGANEWYLWWGNAVPSYYAHPVVRSIGRLSAVAAFLAGMMLRLQPRMRVLKCPNNAAQVARMLRLANHLRVASVAIAVLLATLTFLLTRRVAA